MFSASDDNDGSNSLREPLEGYPDSRKFPEVYRPKPRRWTSPHLDPYGENEDDKRQRCDQTLPVSQYETSHGPPNNPKRFTKRLFSLSHETNPSSNIYPVPFSQNNNCLGSKQDGDWQQGRRRSAQEKGLTHEAYLTPGQIRRLSVGNAPFSNPGGPAPSFFSKDKLNCQTPCSSTGDDEYQTGDDSHQTVPTSGISNQEGLQSGQSMDEEYQTGSSGNSARSRHCAPTTTSSADSRRHSCYVPTQNAATQQVRRNTFPANYMLNDEDDTSLLSKKRRDSLAEREREEEIYEQVINQQSRNTLDDQGRSTQPAVPLLCLDTVDSRNVSPRQQEPCAPRTRIMSVSDQIDSSNTQQNSKNMTRNRIMSVTEPFNMNKDKMNKQPLSEMQYALEERQQNESDVAAPALLKPPPQRVDTNRRPPLGHGQEPHDYKDNERASEGNNYYTNLQEEIQQQESEIQHKDPQYISAVHKEFLKHHELPSNGPRDHQVQSNQLPADASQGAASNIHSGENNHHVDNEDELEKSHNYNSFRHAEVKTGRARIMSVTEPFSFLHQRKAAQKEPAKPLAEESFGPGQDYSCVASNTPRSSNGQGIIEAEQIVTSPPIPSPPTPPAPPSPDPNQTSTGDGSPNISFKTRIQMLVAIKRMSRKRKLREELNKKQHTNQAAILSETVEQTFPGPGQGAVKPNRARIMSVTEPFTPQHRGQFYRLTSAVEEEPFNVEGGSPTVSSPHSDGCTLENQDTFNQDQKYPPSALAVADAQPNSDNNSSPRQGAAKPNRARIMSITEPFTPQHRGQFHQITSAAEESCNVEEDTSAEASHRVASCTLGNQAKSTHQKYPPSALAVAGTQPNSDNNSSPTPGGLKPNRGRIMSVTEPFTPQHRGQFHRMTSAAEESCNVEEQSPTVQSPHSDGFNVDEQVACIQDQKYPPSALAVADALTNTDNSLRQGAVKKNRARIMSITEPFTPQHRGQFHRMTSAAEEESCNVERESPNVSSPHSDGCTLENQITSNQDQKYPPSALAVADAQPNSDNNSSLRPEAKKNTRARIMSVTEPFTPQHRGQFHRMTSAAEEESCNLEEESPNVSSPHSDGFTVDEQVTSIQDQKYPLSALAVADAQSNFDNNYPRPGAVKPNRARIMSITEPFTPQHRGQFYRLPNATEESDNVEQITSNQDKKYPSSALASADAQNDADNKRSPRQGAVKPNRARIMSVTEPFTPQNRGQFQRLTSLKSAAEESDNVEQSPVVSSLPSGGFTVEEPITSLQDQNYPPSLLADAQTNFDDTNSPRQGAVKTNRARLMSVTEPFTPQHRGQFYRLTTAADESCRVEEESPCISSPHSDSCNVEDQKYPHSVSAGADIPAPPPPPSPPPPGPDQTPTSDGSPTVSMKTRIQMLVAIKRMSRKRRLKQELQKKEQTNQAAILSDLVQLVQTHKGPATSVSKTNEIENTKNATSTPKAMLNEGPPDANDQLINSPQQQVKKDRARIMSVTEPFTIQHRKRFDQNVPLKTSGQQSHVFEEESPSGVPDMSDDQMLSSVPAPPAAPPPPPPESNQSATSGDGSPIISLKTRIQMMVAIKRMNRKRQLKAELKKKQQTSQAAILGEVVQLDKTDKSQIQSAKVSGEKDQMRSNIIPSEEKNNGRKGSTWVGGTTAPAIIRRISETPQMIPEALPEIPSTEENKHEENKLDVNKTLTDTQLGRKYSGTLTSSDDHFAKVGKFLLEMYTHDRLSDTVAKAGSYSFSAHQAVLATHSSNLAKQILMSAKDDHIVTHKQVTLPEGVTPVAFQILLEYMYSGKLHAAVENLAEVLRAAVCLQLTAVEDHCRHCLEDLSLQDILSVLETADKHNITDLVAWALKRVAADFVTVVMTERFLQLDIECVLGLLARDDLFVSSEGDVAEAAVNWMDYSLKHRRIHMRRLFLCVRFPLMSTLALLKLSSSAPYLQEDEVISAKIVKANWYRSFLEANVLPPANMEVPVPRLSTCPSSMDTTIEQSPSSFRQSRMADLDRHQSACATDECSARVVFAVGGYNPDSENPCVLANSVYQCENMESDWENVTEIPEPRVHHAAAALGNLLFVIGGSDPMDRKLRAKSKVFCYNPCTKEWFNRPYINMNTARMYHCAATMDNKIYAIGGQDESDNILSSVECYDADRKRWRPVSPMRYRRIGPSVVVYDQVILVAGGYGQPENNASGPNGFLDSVEYFLRHTKCWTEVKSLTVPRCFASMGKIGDDILICGGLTTITGKTNCGLMAAMESYNQTQGSWQPIGQLNSPVYDTGSVVIDEKMYLIGGLTSRNVATANVESFDHVTRSSKSAATFPHCAAGMQCVVWQKKY